VVLVHHSAKTEKKGVYSGRGASAIGAAVDVVVNMEAIDSDSIRLKVDKNRISGDYMTLFIKKRAEKTALSPLCPLPKAFQGLRSSRCRSLFWGLTMGNVFGIPMKL